MGWRSWGSKLDWLIGCKQCMRHNQTLIDVQSRNICEMEHYFAAFPMKILHRSICIRIQPFQRNWPMSLLLPLRIYLRFHVIHNYVNDSAVG